MNKGVVAVSMFVIASLAVLITGCSRSTGPTLSGSTYAFSDNYRASLEGNFVFSNDDSGYFELTGGDFIQEGNGKKYYRRVTFTYNCDDASGGWTAHIKGNKSTGENWILHND